MEDVEKIRLKDNFAGTFPDSRKVLFRAFDSPWSLEHDAEGKEIRNQREIDFIATLGSKKYYIQSAYAIPDEEKYEQETIPFDKTADSFKKIIIVDKSMKPRCDEKGYVTMGVKEFLLDKNSMEA